MPIDNRKKSKEADANLEEILKDDSPIPEDNPSDTPSDSGDVPVEEPTETPETPVEDPPESPNYEEKFKNSTREALTLHFKNKQITDKIDEAANLSEPTDEEMRIYVAKRGADWETLDDLTKSVFKDSFLNSQRFNLINEANKANRDLDVWEAKVTEFVGAPETIAKFPALGDYEVSFKRYCMKEQRRGMHLEELVAAFLYNQAEKETPKPPKKRSILLSGGGGGGQPAKPKKMTADQARALRLSKPKVYKQMIKDGKINLDLLDSE